MKILNNFEAKEVIKKLKKQKKISVLCHGVFDLIHYGHLEHFKEAKSLGDKLFVSITSSSFVNKGPGRPYFNDEKRAEFLSVLELVDYVIINKDETCIKLIKEICPDIFCKGPDYQNISSDITNNIKLEIQAVKSVKGKIITTSGETFSSSNLLNNFFYKRTSSAKKNIQILKKKFNFLDIVKIFNSFEDLKILIVGEIIIDQYNFCKAIGKSGKESMMVFKDLNTINFLGGAGYIAKNIESFCKKVDLLSMIGSDTQYESFIESNLGRNIKKIFIRKKNSPTVLKKRYVDNMSNSKIVGVYQYSESPFQKHEKKNLYNKVNNLKKYDLILIADFGHNMIDETLIKLLKKKSKNILANAQLNAVNKGYHDLKRFKNINCLLINESELRFEMRDQESKIESLMKVLKKNMKINNLIVTRGKEGVICLNAFNNFFYNESYSNNVVDKVGSGDCLMSIISLFVAKKYDETLSLLCGSLAAADAVQNFGNRKIANKTTILKSIQHLLK